MAAAIPECSLAAHADSAGGRNRGVRCPHSLLEGSALGTEGSGEERSREAEKKTILIEPGLLTPEQRLAEIARIISTAIETVGEDAGVVILDYQGTTYFDHELKAHVYDHEYFSPLGDALMAVFKLAKGNGR